MKIIKRNNITTRKKILDSSKSYSFPLRSIDSFFDNVPISESIKIKSGLICKDRYFAGIVKDDQRGFKNSAWSTCNSLGMDDNALKEIFSIKDINQFYVGAQKLNKRIGYRVYAGSYDDSKSKGEGKAVEWNGKNKYTIREYVGHRYENVEDLSKDSLKILKENKELNDIIMNFLLSVSGEKNLTDMSNCVKSYGKKRNTIDVSLDFSGSNIIKCKKSISRLFEYFDHAYTDYYSFFLGHLGSSLITRCQWGIDSKSEEFINIYFMQKRV